MEENKNCLTLDGKPVTIQQLQEAQANKAVRIIEKAPGEYVTLKKMQG